MMIALIAQWKEAKKEKYRKELRLLVEANMLEKNEDNAMVYRNRENTMYAVLEKQESRYVCTLVAHGTPCEVPVVVAEGDDLFTKIEADSRIWEKLEQETTHSQLRGLSQNQQAKYQKLAMR